MVCLYDKGFYVMHVIFTGNAVNNTQCQACSLGQTFSAVHSLQPCHICSKCPSYSTTTHLCNRTQDVKCGESPTATNYTSNCVL